MAHPKTPAKPAPRPAPPKPAWPKPITRQPAAPPPPAPDRFVLPPSPDDPLWPIRLPVVGFTGEFAEGKTLAILDLNPDPTTTLLYDSELSSTTYEEYGHDTVNMSAEMEAKYPAGYKNTDLWLWWTKDVIARLNAKRYRVLGIDTVSELEESLASWVWANPTLFRKTAAVYAKSSGLFWGDVKSVWLKTLSHLASKVDTLAFTAHMSADYGGGNAPIPGRRKPKGKETLTQLATLYLKLRRPLIRGEKRSVPEAVVIKSRLSRFLDTPYGKTPVKVLPDFIDQYTAGRLRWYMENPVGNNVAEEDRLPEESPTTEAEILAMRIAAAGAEAEAATIVGANVDKIAKTRKAEADFQKRLAEADALTDEPAESPAEEPAAELPAEEPAKEPAAETPAAAEPTDAEYLDPNGPAGDVQLEFLEKCHATAGRAGMSAAGWTASLKKRGAETLNELSYAAAKELSAALAKRYGGDLATEYEALYGEELAV